MGEEEYQVQEFSFDISSTSCPKLGKTRSSKGAQLPKCKVFPWISITERLADKYCRTDRHKLCNSSPDFAQSTPLSKRFDPKLEEP